MMADATSILARADLVHGRQVGELIGAVWSWTMFICSPPVATHVERAGLRAARAPAPRSGPAPRAVRPDPEQHPSTACLRRACELASRRTRAEPVARGGLEPETRRSCDRSS